MPSVPANTSASIAASGKARLRLRISGVVSSTSPSRRKRDDQNAGIRRKRERHGASAFAGGPRARRSRSIIPPTTPKPNT